MKSCEKGNYFFHTSLFYHQVRFQLYVISHVHISTTNLQNKDFLQERILNM